jgi:hypothetical protein
LSALINTVLKPQSSEKKRIFFLGWVSDYKFSQGVSSVKWL